MLGQVDVIKSDLKGKHMVKIHWLTVLNELIFMENGFTKK
jgi:hypothetical protein